MSLYLCLDAAHAKLDLRKLKVSLSKAKNMDFKFVPEKQRSILLAPFEDESLISAFEKILGEQDPFELNLSGVWAYPNQSEGRLLYVGVQNSVGLQRLYAKVAELSGGPEDLRPNLPIVRLRNHREVSDVISPYKNAEFGALRIERAMIYEKLSSGAFPTFRMLRGIEFGSPI